MCGIADVEMWEYEMITFVFFHFDKLSAELLSFILRECGAWALMRVGVVSHHRIIALSLQYCVFLCASRESVCTARCAEP